jgi:DNA topoisomerase IB
MGTIPGENAKSSELAPFGFVTHLFGRGKISKSRKQVQNNEKVLSSMLCVIDVRRHWWGLSRLFLLMR